MAKKIEFKDQYKHPKWQKKRLEILERENYTCQCCGDTETTLHVHHGYYERNKKLWEYDGFTMWCFCSECHEMWDQRKIRIHKMIARFNMQYYEDLEMILCGVNMLQTSCINSKNE